MIATIFWFLYLLVCPVATLIVIFVSSWLPDDFVGAVCASAIGIAVLVFVFGPVYTDMGFMSWWLSGEGLTSFKGARYLVWQYALVCLGLSAALIALKHRRNGG